jgi:glutamate N-acetyltransferase/amino-acid N-acetyltransferase
MFNIFPIKNGLDNVEGFFSSGVSVGLKPDNGLDVAFIRSEKLCDVSAVFTTNKFQAAPLKHFQKYPKGFQTDFVLMNSKNANAMTGAKGIEDIDDIFDSLDLKVTNPVMSSTGVIGYGLNKEKIISSFSKFDFNSKNSTSASKAIMTTDKFAKELCYKVELENGEYFHIAGIAKGAGMINPCLATMLCFIITDANIPKQDIDELLQKKYDSKFQCNKRRWRYLNK